MGIRDESWPSNLQIHSLSEFSVKEPCPPDVSPPGWTRENPRKMSTGITIRRSSEAMKNRVSIPGPGIPLQCHYGK